MTRRIFQGIFAPLAFLALAALIGFAAARFFAGDHTPPETELQAVTLPPEWREGSPDRGLVGGLAAAGETILVAGPGLGVYFTRDQAAWHPLNAGLGKDKAITSLTMTRRGPLIGTSEGRLYLWERSSWKLIAGPQDQTPIFWAAFVEGQVAFSNRDGVFLQPFKGSPKKIDFGWETKRNAAYLKRTHTIRKGDAPRVVLAWLSGEGSAILEEKPLPEALPIHLSPDSKSGTCAVRPAPGQTGLFKNGVALLAEDVMRHPILDIDIRAPETPEPGAYQTLLAVENLGLVVVLIRDGKAEKVTTIRNGLPLEPLASAIATKDEVFVGTKGKGVFVWKKGENQFRPANAGLLYLPQK